jgi:hypothetical protein
MLVKFSNFNTYNLDDLYQEIYVNLSLIIQINSFKVNLKYSR